MNQPLEITRIDTRRHDVEQALTALRAKLSPAGNVVSEAGKQRTVEVFGEPLSPQEVVERICGEVQKRGLAAVLEYSRKLDKAELTAETIRVSAAELQAAHAKAEPEFLATVRQVRENVLEFQRAILHHDVEVKRPGVVLRQRYLPLARVGVCVPGGAAAYPSTVLMTVVPAQAAGVREIAVVSPPTANGANNADVLATCHELGVTEVYRVGGAQGVAALAYGAGPIRQVDKIVGPGNLFVALAKRHVYGQVDIDSIAGPSEVVLIADDTTRPDFTAADMLAQAEHAPGASILVTWCERLLEATAAELQRQVEKLSRSELTIQSLRDFGCLILVRDEEEACRITDLLAPEHLHIATDSAERLAARIRNAGATFLGNFSPVALGDYAAGPSHVLPTGGTARWASGLSANHFLRSSSVITYAEDALRTIAPHIQQLADKEGLTAHRASVEVRMEGQSGNRKAEIGSAASGFPLSAFRFASTFRPNILAMDGYTPGEQPQAGKFIKLNTNENPYPPPPGIRRAMEEVLERGLQRYPDPMANSFRLRAAEVLNLPGKDWILAGNGSDDILTICTRAFVGPGELLRLPYPSYILYRSLAQLQDARWEEVKFNPDWTLPAAFGNPADGLKLVFLPNPNSPTGTMISREAILDFAERLPCPLLIDEAYVDFADFNCLDLVARSEKIMVSRTLSKSYGLAGLRFGYIVAQPHFIEQLIKVKDSYNCDSLSIAAATAGIGDQAWLAENRARNIATRTRLAAGLSELGFTVIPSQSNFVWCTHPAHPAKPLYEQLKQNRILVRYMNYPGWSDGLRISVGTDEQTSALFSLLRTMIAS